MYLFFIQTLNKTFLASFSCISLYSWHSRIDIFINKSFSLSFSHSFHFSTFQVCKKKRDIPFFCCIFFQPYIQVSIGNLPFLCTLLYLCYLESEQLSLSYPMCVQFTLHFTWALPFSLVFGDIFFHAQERQTRGENKFRKKRNETCQLFFVSTNKYK